MSQIKKNPDFTSTVHIFGSKEITQESMVKSIYIIIKMLMVIGLQICSLFRVKSSGNDRKAERFYLLVV